MFNPGAAENWSVSYCFGFNFSLIRKCSHISGLSLLRLVFKDMSACLSRVLVGLCVLNVCITVCADKHACVGVYVFICACMFVCVSVHVCLCVCVCVSTSVSVFLFISFHH